MTRAQRHQLRRHWREPREKETDAGETRDAGTCVSHGLPMATHAANVRGYRPTRSGQRCLYTYGKSVRIVYVTL